jgi:hypothetical protein
MLAPTHTLAGPLTAPASGSGFTERVAVVAILPQLLLTLYIIVSTPADTPVVTPLKTFADVLLLLHKPPAERSDNVIVEPGHTFTGPAMVPAIGNESMVINAVCIQPVGNT